MASDAERWSRLADGGRAPGSRWERDKERARTYVARARAELIKRLGGKCVDCKTTERLEFDHLKPRTWTNRKTSQHCRINRLRAEAERGELELRCRSCNARKGKPGRRRA